MTMEERPHKWSGAWKEDPDLKEALEEIIEAIVSGDLTDRDAVQNRKLEVSRRHRLDSMPTNSMLLDYIRETGKEVTPAINSLLLKKPTRTLSGVAVVAVMTSPHDCPHGRCRFCPGGTSRDIPTPQSYTGKEPAAMRAAMNDYDPYRQTLNRISQLESVGHPTDKIDLILMGGTLTAREIEYQRYFVKGCLDAMNGRIASSLEESQGLNERSDHRCIGMTFETRPDHFGIDECDTTLALGGTRVELGVQSTFDEPLDISGRGHGIKETIDATRIAKDSGLKVSYHLMPGLPGSNMDMDFESASRAFELPEFGPDMIKIYPTLVVKGTELYDMWKDGEYQPLSTEEAANVVARIKRITPPWVRIQRVQRDIPTNVIDAGVDMSNLRQVAGRIMDDHGWKCRCIRCREIGHRLRDGMDLPSLDEVELVRRDYFASGGKEVFLSYEHKETDSLMGYIRLRGPFDGPRGKEIENIAYIREVKVFGRMVEIGKDHGNNWQHRGIGRELIGEAERISRDEMGRKEILVTSGIGVREYYRKLGYSRSGPYMAKPLDG